LQLFGDIGLSYDLKIGANSYMSPAINFYIPFTNISKVDWKVNTVQFALNLKLPIYEPKPITVRDTIFEKDTTVIVDKSVKTEFVRLTKTTRQTKIIANEKDKIERTIIKEYYERVLPKEVLLEVSFDVFGVDKQGKKTENPTLIIEEVETRRRISLLHMCIFPAGEKSLEKKQK
jgi:hypothetical protein